MYAKKPSLAYLSYTSILDDAEPYRCRSRPEQLYPAVYGCSRSDRNSH